MKGISPNINITIASQTKNFDATAIRFGKNKGLCVVADGTKNKGVLSGEWASYLCNITPFPPIHLEVCNFKEVRHQDFLSNLLFPQHNQYMGCSNYFIR
ncbi:MAG: hypothetical protein K8R68_08515 [Bacteroidales bacterium]|nr:hypothetical protein [Bacteroidales bacterium]